MSTNRSRSRSPAVVHKQSFGDAEEHIIVREEIPHRGSRLRDLSTGRFVAEDSDLTLRSSALSPTARQASPRQAQAQAAEMCTSDACVDCYICASRI
jgi:hypothetical protein